VVVYEERTASTNRNHLLRANIMFLPKKLGCDVVVKVPVPPWAMYNKGIMRDGSSSDVMALEHIDATLHLDSGCGEDGLLADVLFQNM
jgi:hypothetical protein